jgi:uncharacterized protein YdiU (UPF0061 family)
MIFTNQFIHMLPGEHNTDRQSRMVEDFWSAISPTPVSQPKMLAYSAEVADLLNLESQWHSTWLNALAGNALLPGMVSYASNYGGHQFGHWAGQLGDGRVIYLGEITNTHGQHFELQLKGAGPTPYSRRSDGRAVLRSSIREFLCSEAMFYLGIPTTRALSLISTGEQIVRDMFYDGRPALEPGAIVCRVAPSFLRFGHFELWASRQQSTKLQQLVDFAMAQYFPDQVTLEDWFAEVCARTAMLISHWQRVGFVHGVMNTDNMSILGLTLDYGPYGWLDDFDPHWTPNTTDAQGKRYAYARQPFIARWNLAQLGNALSLLTQKTNWINQGLAQFDQVYQQQRQTMLAAKFGFDTITDADWQQTDEPLINQAFDLLALAEVDMTLFFTGLAAINLHNPDPVCLRSAFYQEALFQQHRPAFMDWLTRYATRCRSLDARQRQARMQQANPRFILRNYLVQQAIEQAESGDLTGLQQLHHRLRTPYDPHPTDATLTAKRPDWAKYKAGCAQLSCSS